MPPLSRVFFFFPPLLWDLKKEKDFDMIAMDVLRLLQTKEVDYSKSKLHYPPSASATVMSLQA